MKKTFTLFAIFIATTLFAQTYVPDDNFETYLETHKANGTAVSMGDPTSMGNGVMDDFVPTTKISNVTNLDVSNKYISDLIGIEDFAALEDLRCYNNSLNSLNIAYNTALIVLHCYNNNIGILDVSQNPNLEALLCNSNSISVLDVSQNPNLIALLCENNTISVLDVSQNTALQYLYCSINQLTSLDVTQNTALTKLKCSGNQLTSLDVTQNTALTDLSCHYNQLTSLELTQNTALTTLSCRSNQLTSLDVSQNIALNNISCEYNQLTNLDVTQNTALEYLKCNDNSLTSLNLYQNTALQVLFCENNSISALNLTQNPNLGNINCQNNQLLKLNIKNGNNTNIYIGAFRATNNPNLTCIEVDNATWSTANWPDIDATASFSDVSCNITYVPDDNFETYLETHDVNGTQLPLGNPLSMGNGVMDDVVPTTRVSNVTALDVHNEHIADLTGIEDFTALTSLNCGFNDLTSLDITQNTSLTSVNCRFNNLTNIDVTHNTALDYLKCNDNQITTLDVTNNIVLTRLLCHQNQLTDLDVTNNTALTELACSFNQLISLNIKNGANTNIINGNFHANYNPNLTCILVDDAAWSTANWNYIDITSTFVNNQAECDALASISENSLESQITIYPNPAKNNFIVQNDSNYIIDNLSVYTLLGKLVLKTNNTNAPINASNLKNGVYLVKITSDSKTAIQKIIINN